MAGRTVEQVAQDVALALAAHDEAAARRVAFDFVVSFDSASAEDRGALVAARPAPCQDQRFDALLAALVEHLCARESIATPGWVEEPGRFLETWWFVSGLRDLHASAIVQSPISFARRGVFVCDGALSYA